MTRRRRLKPCPLVGKVRYTSEAAALRFGVLVLKRWHEQELNRHLPELVLWVYECLPRFGGCGDWHHTSKDQGDERRVVWPPREEDAR